VRSSSKNLKILFEDNHLIVVNKRVGDLVQGDKTGDTPLSDLLKAYLKEKYQKPGKVYLGVVHRLDRPTTGIVVFAKTSKALERLNKMLREKTIQKQTREIGGHPCQLLEKKPKKQQGYGFQQRDKRQ
jgi:23S rRNA pseudouridine1911/1915/1917 synthase